jgi:hypothetical protein
VSRRVETFVELVGVGCVLAAAFMTAVELGVALVGVALVAAGNIPRPQAESRSRREGV